MKERPQYKFKITFFPWKLVYHQINLSVLSWLLCSICPRNLLWVCPTPAIPKIRYFFLTFVLLAEGSDWLRCGNPPLEAGDLPSLVVLLPPSSAVMLAFLGSCVTKGGSHYWEKSMGFQGLFASGELCMLHGRGVSQQLPCSHLGSSSWMWSTEQLHLQPSMPPGFPLNQQGREVLAAWLNAARSFGRCL